MSTDDACSPLTINKVPVLTCDVCEHAFFIDYRHNRADYINAFWKIVNWEHANSQLK